MTFQLVRASDNDIVVWNTDHGHVFIYTIEHGARELTYLSCRAAPEAAVEPATLQDEACLFATAEARARKLLG